LLTGLPKKYILTNSVYSAHLCPYRYKRELVAWAVKYKGWKYHKANKLKKKQLYKIWYKS